jgi:hypothetical protein
LNLKFDHEIVKELAFNFSKKLGYTFKNHLGKLLVYLIIYHGRERHTQIDHANWFGLWQLTNQKG